ncbi:hypothetical protein FRC09_000597, partial [Ceratobasidium sp. 395]
MTVKNVYPLPQTNNLIEKLRSAKIFTKLDLKWGYDLVCICKGDKWKTAFKTKYGLFKYIVMPFGLTNAPATFQHLMNDILCDILDVFVIVYLHDILIFSKDPRDHPGHVKEVLSCLKKHNLYCNLEKCFFDITEIDYLGLIVLPEGVCVDQEKVTKAVDWKAPHNVKSLQEFLGFVNFYRKFVPYYSTKARTLFNLLRKDTVWNWDKDAQEAYEALKQTLKSAPLLIQPDPAKHFYLETDASDYATGGVLSQIAEDGKMHPIAFLSKSSSPAERNYDIYNKELLAVIKSGSTPLTTLQAQRAQGNAIEELKQKYSRISKTVTKLESNLEEAKTANKLLARKFKDPEDNCQELASQFEESLEQQRNLQRLCDANADLAALNTLGDKENGGEEEDEQHAGKNNEGHAPGPGAPETYSQEEIVDAALLK